MKIKILEVLNWLLNGLKIKSFKIIQNLSAILKYIFQKILKNIKSIKNKSPMSKMLIITFSILGLIFGFKGFGTYMMKKYMGAAVLNAAVTISAETVAYQKWQPKLRVSGSLKAAQGVELTAEVPGLVRQISFISGHQAKAGEVLVELNVDADRSQLDSLKALAELAEVNYRRDTEQYAAKAISRSALDASLADFKSKQAQVQQQIDLIEKKIIRAPFNGKLGISQINEGQYVESGQKIVTLQALDPILVDFFVPQQELDRIKLGQSIEIKTEKKNKDENKSAAPYLGVITAIDPLIDINTRNAHIQATVPNPNHELLPGMFAAIDVFIGSKISYLTLPQTAISFNPYGNIVFVITENGKDEKGESILMANQVFVTLGETRGDQIAVLTGIKEGDKVVTSGQLKLKNGTRVKINNTVLPSNNPFPVVVDD